MLFRVVLLALILLGPLAGTVKGQPAPETERSPRQAHRLGLNVTKLFQGDGSEVTYPDSELLWGVRFWVSERFVVGVEAGAASLWPEDAGQFYPAIVQTDERPRVPRLGGRVEWHGIHSGSMSPFVAVGGSVAHASLDREVYLYCGTIPCPDEYQVTFQDHAAVTALTATLEVGLEAWIGRYLSVRGAYGFAMEYSRARFEPTYPAGTTALPGPGSLDQVRAGNGVPRFALSIYF